MTKSMPSVKNAELKKRILAEMQDSVNKINEFGNTADLYASALEMAASIQNDALPDLSENRRKQVRDLNTILMKMTMVSTGAQGVIFTLKALMSNFKVKIANHNLGFENVSLEELLVFFDEAITLLETIKNEDAG